MHSLFPKKVKQKYLVGHFWQHSNLFITIVINTFLTNIIHMCLVSVDAYLKFQMILGVHLWQIDVFILNRTRALKLLHRQNT